MMRWMVVGFSALATAVAPVDAQRAGARDRDRSEEYESRIDTTLSLTRGGTVDLSLISGEIQVTGSSRNDVRIRAVSERGRIELSASPNRIAVAVKPVRRGGDAEYEVAVPAGTRVIMRAVQGDISASDVRGEIEATTVNGDVEIANAASRVIAGTVSGSIMISGVTGAVRGNAVSGDVTIERVQGDIEAETVSGDVVLDEVSSRSVRTESVSGDVHYEGTFEASGRYEFRSHSGDIRLVVPADFGALLTLETFSGEIESDFPLQLQPTREEHGRPRTMQFTLGRGGARVDVETFSGDVRLERRGARPE